MRRLPYDFSRCQGVECVVRDGCLRYTALNDMGPWTPITEQMCDYNTPGATNHFIDVEESRTKEKTNE